MGRDELGHLEHGDLGFAAEDWLEKRVGIDVAPVLRVLETVFLDVVPDLLGEFAAREGRGTDNGSEDGVGLNGFEEGGVGFAFGFGFGRHDLWLGFKGSTPLAGVQGCLCSRG